ncbi:Uncharacterised protein [Raoultella terrigena]|uniref:Uncharacterized protein n=1 Tax=Raoultella terrigena TaxID=577 RepID=A0A4U9D994_RAOTE|nr:Uncharacterised protein [Raoultella terrigena]
MTNANDLLHSNRRSFALLWGLACLVMLGVLLTLLPQSADEQQRAGDAAETGAWRRSSEPQ